jgi:hypothetical protein
MTGFEVRRSVGTRPKRSNERPRQAPGKVPPATTAGSTASPLGPPALLSGEIAAFADLQRSVLAGPAHQ